MRKKNVLSYSGHTAITLLQQMGIQLGDLHIKERASMIS
jgi:hypothetical protein